MKVGIIIITYNISSEIFLLQIAAIKKFCTDDFVIEIIENSSNLNITADLEYHSRELGLGYVKTFASSSNGTDSHSFAANFAFQRYKDRYEYFFYLDHDCIPVKSFSVVDILGEDKFMAGIGQGAKKKYFWPGLFMFKIDGVDKDLVDFNFNHELGLDTGGNLYKLIEEYGEDKCIFFNEAYHQNPYFNSNQYAHYATINNDMFMHFINSSNWSGVDRQEERINSLINIAKEKTGL